MQILGKVVVSMKGGRILVDVFIFCNVSVILFCSQYYHYYFMLSLILRWFSFEVYTKDLFQHGNKKF